MKEPTASRQTGDQSPIEARLVAPPAQPGDLESADQASRSGTSLIQGKGTVLAILFLVTGALGIPLLWVNPNFSMIEKVVWSIIVCLYTAMFVAIAGAIVMWCYRVITGY